jgi:ATP-dependent RNA helicase SUPV3L1/SUV3
VKKWDGRVERQLSDSQIKQIAGRAGRYGLHSDNPCGLVTTMNSDDLPKVADALAAPPKPLLHARMQCPRHVLEEAFSALPSGSRTSVLQDAVMYLGQLKPTFRLAELPRMRDITDFLDAKGGALSFTDYRQFMQAPIPWRDVACVDVLEAFLKMYTGRLDVRLITAVRHARPDLTGALKEVEKSIAMPGLASAPHANLSETLSLMESFHRIVTLYLWMSYRNPVVWSDFDACIDLKWRLEKALEWCLRSISWDKAEKGRPSRGRHSARGEPVSYMTAVDQRRVWEEKKAAKVQQRVLLPLG